MKRPLAGGALLGGLGAIAGALAGHHVRKSLRHNMPDVVVGLLEDAVAVGGGAAITAVIATTKWLAFIPRREDVRQSWRNSANRDAISSREILSVLTTAQSFTRKQRRCGTFAQRNHAVPVGCFSMGRPLLDFSKAVTHI